MPSFKVNIPSRLGCLVFGLLIAAAAPPAFAATSGEDVKSVTIPALPYPQSGLRQRLASEGKSVPPVDVSLQADIPGHFYPPHETAGGADVKHPAVIALPDCDDSFPASWVSTLQEQGIGVLVISPNKAHPSQGYCTEGSLDTPKHGLTYWAFDAISALDYLARMDAVDANRIAIFGYGYGAGAAQLAIYRNGHAKHFDHRFKTLVGLRPQCMSEMDNFVPSLLIGVKNDPFNPPAWCQWRIDRDLRPDREPVRFELVESGEMIEKQATRKTLEIENSSEVVTLVTEFLSAMGIAKNIGRN
ncbi:MAG: dienelactone hydrolase family protein [Thalassospira sp.]|uniref:dienelactone hydrolase family protein n=1 Tax=Thalassospira sp. TaxID=1912094 RepID=UPI003A88457F